MKRDTANDTADEFREQLTLREHVVLFKDFSERLKLITFVVFLFRVFKNCKSALCVSSASVSGAYQRRTDSRTS